MVRQPPTLGVPRRASRADVARAVGVSEYTVSVVLNGAAYGRVSPSVRQKVEAVAAQLGYAPRSIGRALRLGRSELIAYIPQRFIQQEIAPYYSQILPTMLTVANDAGFDLVIVGDERDESVVAKMQRAAASRRFDAVILDRPTVHDRLVDVLMAAHVPTVVYGGHLHRDIPTIRRNVDAMTAQLVNHLARKRHCRWGFAMPHRYDELDQYNLIVLRATRAAIESVDGTTVADLTLLDLSADRQELVERVRQQKLTAILASDDDTARSLIADLERVNLRVPNDIAIASLYGYGAQIEADGQLTSIRARPADAGRAAMVVAIALAQGQPLPKQVVEIPSWLCLGRSTGDVALIQPVGNLARAVFRDQAAAGG